MAFAWISADDPRSAIEPHRVREVAPRLGFLAVRLSTSEDESMTTSTVITMVLVLGFVWGGFFLALYTAVRKESDKGD